MGRVHLKPKDFLEGEATVVTIRGYLRRRELQGVGRVMERNKRRGLPPLLPTVCSDYLRKAAGALGQSRASNGVLQKSLRSLTTWVSFTLIACILVFLLTFSWLWHHDRSPDSHGPLATLFQCANNTVFSHISCWLYLFSRKGKKVSISIPHIQPQCLGLNEVFPAEFGVFVLPGSNPLPLK